MKLILVFFALITAYPASAQFAIINDPDGFTNVREGRSANTRITGRFFKDDVFMYSYDSGDKQWASVYFNPDSTRKKTLQKTIQGYINRAHIIPVDSLKHIPRSAKYRVQKGNELHIENDSIKLIVTTIPFNPARHRIYKDKEGNVQKIDGASPGGVDGELPAVELAAIHLLINGTAVNIPVKEYSDLYQPGIGSFNVFFGKEGIIYLYMPGNSDGAGSYCVVWMIRNGQYMKRYVDVF